MPPLLYNPQTKELFFHDGDSWVLDTSHQVRQGNGKWQVQIGGQWIDANTTTATFEHPPELTPPQQAAALTSQKSLLKPSTQSLANTVGNFAQRFSPGQFFAPQTAQAAPQQAGPQASPQAVNTPTTNPDRQEWQSRYPGIPFRTRQVLERVQVGTNQSTGAPIYGYQYNQVPDWAGGQDDYLALQRFQFDVQGRTQQQALQAQQGQQNYNLRTQEAQMNAVKSPADYYLLSQAMQQRGTGGGYNPNFSVARSPIAQQDVPVESQFLDQNPQYRSSQFADTHGRLPGTPYFGSPNPTQTTFAPQGQGLQAYDNLYNLASGQGGGNVPSHLPEGTPALLGPGAYASLSPSERSIYAAEFQRQGVPQEDYQFYQNKALEPYNQPRLGQLRVNARRVRGGY